MNNRLSGKIIIITGGSGLLGKSIIERLISEGAFCINLDKSLTTNETLSEIKCDITSSESVLEAIKLVVNRYEKIDGLVNNAYPRTSDWGFKFEDINLQSWKTNVDWQLNSYFYVSQIVSSYMEKQNYGVIINMSSIYGVVGPDFSVYDNTNMTMPAAYSAIKSGLIGLTRYMAAYLGKYNIRVNAISPGGILDGQPESFVNNYCKKTPLKRMGNPGDIAPSVAFLLSDDARYISGHNLVIDGGWTIV